MRIKEICLNYCVKEDVPSIKVNAFLMNNSTVALN